MSASAAMISTAVQRYSTGQRYSERQKLDWLLENVINFQEKDVVYGITALLIPTANSEVEMKDLQRKINKIGAEVFSKDGIVYICLPRKKQFSLLTQGLLMISLSITMNLALLLFMLYF